jgi:uncharacterized LabA/DUF88 family protein
MAGHSDTESMALFCDFENVALGVRDARIARFDIQKVLERLLLKGSIVVKKAYCDWERYKDFKAPMHEASFELIEIPHVRQSGKNSADIRLVVDALDLCYTKSHVDTFVILSGDSDFSPLVSKLRENNKTVIGVGVKQSSSDLLVANCDEFIFYDDLVRAEKTRRTRSRRKPSDKAAENGHTAVAAVETGVVDAGETPLPSPTRAVASESPAEPEENRRHRAIALVIETLEALATERGAGERIWGSMVKQTLKRRQPGFNEAYYGYRSFSKLLEDAKAQGLIDLELDEKSGGYILRLVTPEESVTGWEPEAQVQEPRLPESLPADEPVAPGVAATPVAEDEAPVEAAATPADEVQPEAEGGEPAAKPKRRRAPRRKT